MRLAIVGPPQSGKTTLFSALTGLEVTETTSREGGVHLGRFAVPDPRLDRLAAALPHPEVKGVSVEIADLRGGIQKSKSDTIKWMFLFWIGQIGAVLGIILAVFK